jgi:hypothetical protein
VTIPLLTAASQQPGHRIVPLRPAKFQDTAYRWDELGLEGQPSLVVAATAQPDIRNS